MTDQLSTGATTARLTPAEARTEFAATREMTYLDVASRAPMSDRVAAELERYIQTYRFDPLPKHAWLERVESVRARVARLLGAEPTEIAFTKSTADSVSQLSHALEIAPGENVIICPEIEHANNVYPWLHMRDKGVEVRMVPARAAGFPVDEAIAAIDERTRVLALSSVSFVTGARADLGALAEACHERGVFLLADAVQELGAMRMDAHELGIDGLGAATQKMLLSMYGLGILYCRADRVEELRPPFLTRMGVDWGRGHESDLDLEGYRLKPGAPRFEVGNPSFVGIFALDAALSLIEDVGPAVIEAHVLALARRLGDGLRGLGAHVITPEEPDRHAGLVAFRHPDGDDLESLLALQGVRVATRRGSVRASVHVFNDESDVDRLLEVVGGALPGAPSR